MFQLLFLSIILALVTLSYSQTEQIDLQKIQKELGINKDIDLDTLLYLLTLKNNEEKINSQTNSNRNNSQTKEEEEEDLDEKEESLNHEEDSVIDFDLIDFDLDSDTSRHLKYKDNFRKNKKLDFETDDELLQTLDKKVMEEEKVKPETDQSSPRVTPPTLFDSQNNILMEEVKSVISKDFSFLSSLSPSSSSSTMRSILSFSKVLAKNGQKLRKLILDTLNNFHPRIKQFYLQLSEYVRQRVVWSAYKSHRVSSDFLYIFSFLT